MMARLHSLSLVTLLVLIGKCQGQRINRNPHYHRPVRMLSRIETRQNGRRIENDIDTDTWVLHHPNPVTSRDSKLLATYCNIDANGYYGSTMGEPKDVVYGYGVETPPNTDMKEIFSAVHTSVETVLLSTFFPSLCEKDGSRRRLLEVTGFRFEPETNPHAGDCTPLMDGDNDCDIYAGTVRVYGEGRNALAVIRDHLDLDSATDIHPRIQRIFSVTVSSNVVSSSESKDVSNSATAGIVVAAVTLMVGVVGLAVFGIIRRRRGQFVKSSEDGVPREVALQDVESPETSLVPIDVETVELEIGTSLSIEDGRPTHVSFDNEVM